MTTLQALDWPNDLRVGFHLSVAGGSDRVFVRFQERGCSALQIFIGSPRTWDCRPWPPERVAAFRAGHFAAGSPPLVVHTRYLINPAAANPLVRERSLATLRHEYDQARAGGADYLVLHMGSHSEPKAGMTLMAEGLQTALGDVASDRPRLLLENTAGERNDLGAAWEDIGAVRDAVRFPVGVCLDTCHLFQAGWDIRSALVRKTLSAELLRRFGTGGVAVVHCNDSLRPFGSHRDRHQHIDQGEIGGAALAAFLLQPLFRGLPVILETPQDDADDPSDDLGNRARLHAALQQAAGIQPRSAPATRPPRQPRSAGG